MLDFLNKKLSGVLNSKIFLFVMRAVMYLNPIALAPQLYSVLVAPSVEGVSMNMWVLFLFIQVAFGLNGVRVKDSTLFWSMAISALESFVIILALLIRA